MSVVVAGRRFSVVGAGKSELARALCGVDPIDDGEIDIEGQSVALGSPRDALDAGIALVPEDRKTQGLVLLMSIAHNIGLNVVNCARVAAPPAFGSRPVSIPCRGG